MMLIDHEAVETGFISELVFIEIPLVVPVGDLRGEVRVRESEAKGRVLVAFRIRILMMRHLAEVVELHLTPSWTRPPGAGHRRSRARAWRTRPDAREEAGVRIGRGDAASRWAAGAGTARRKSGGRSCPGVPRRPGSAPPPEGGNRADTG